MAAGYWSGPIAEGLSPPAYGRHASAEVGRAFVRPVRQTPSVRIGTWNLQGRWDERHLDQITVMNCGILLLTEVPEGVQLREAGVHFSCLSMAAGRRWAAIGSRKPLRALPDPHGASAMAQVDRPARRTTHGDA